MTQFYVNNFYIILGEIVGRQHCANTNSVQVEMYVEALRLRCGASQIVCRRLKIEGIPRPAGKYSYGLTDTYT